MKKITYCTNCVYPVNAVNLNLDEHGVCTSCKTAESFEELSSDFWVERKIKFEKLINQYKKDDNANYDCLIPVSGGKDSFYQAHVIAKESMV